MKYEYGFKSWGGFYDEEYKAKHGREAGLFYFDTEEEREQHIKELRDIGEAKGQVVHCFEGYTCREVTTLHRVSKYDGKEVYSKRELFPDSTYEAAESALSYRWYLGCNDYPFGEDFDYENEMVETVEWITGSFVY
jgi:hypothetical protein